MVLDRILPITCVAVVAMFVVTAPDASAAPINYEFVAGTSVTWDGYVSTIAGTFTYDAATQTESNVDVVLSGVAPFATTYIDPNDAASVFIGGSGNTIVGYGTPGTGAVPLIELEFVNPLNVSPDDLDSSGQIFFDAFDDSFTECSTQPGCFSTSVNGGVVAAPEPATWTLMLVSVFGIGFMMCGSRHKSAPALA
jgi:hypothetical protein